MIVSVAGARLNTALLLTSLEVTSQAAGDVLSDVCLSFGVRQERYLG